MTRLSDIARTHGFSPICIDYTDTQDPAIRADRLRELLRQETAPFLLVGSSMGGYAAMIGATEFSGCQGVFLLAPALFMPHYPDYDYASTTQHVHIVHGTDDDVVPIAGSQALAEQHDYTLHLVKDGHRLIETLAQTEQWFKDFLLNLNSLRQS